MPLRFLRTPSTLLALSLPLLGAIAACGRAHDASDNRDEFAGETRKTEIEHEACDGTGKTSTTNKAEDRLAKGAAYVTHVFDGGREICSFSDLNGDGRVDLWTYYDASGAPRRHEAAYGIAKDITEVGTYKGGELAVVARDTTKGHHFDTWDYYEAGKLIRRERDKNGDGRLDEWWTFEVDGASIIQADPRTGKPDPQSALKIDVGNGGAPPAPPPKAAPKASAAPSGSVSAAPPAASATPAASVAPAASSAKVVPQ